MNPYDLDLNLDSLFKFGFKIKGGGFPTDDNSIELQFLFNGDHVLESRIASQFQTLNLYDLYKTHLNEVRDLITKEHIYSEGYLDEIVDQFPGLFDSKIEMEKLIMGHYDGLSEFHHRPLSKLTRDVLDQLAGRNLGYEPIDH